MFPRPIVLILGLLLVPLSPVPAAAIVALCPNGFNNCDPYSGTCYTAWATSLAGQVQAQCAADPSSCWRQKITSPPTCDDPATPPVNPNALRVCPPLADCGEGTSNPFNLTPNPRPPAGQIWDCMWLGGTAQVPPWTDMVDAQTCAAHFIVPLSQQTGDPRFAMWFPSQTIPGGAREGQSLAFGELSHVPFEALNPTCGWDIRPALPITPCVLPQSAMIAAMKNDSHTQWIGLSKYYKRLNKRHAKLSWALNNGLFGEPMSKRYEAKVARLVWIIDLSSLIVQLVSDPPNDNYQVLPGPGVYPPLTPLTPDATLTQAEINAIQAWLAPLREAVITGRQLTETIDNLAGALIAAEAGAPGAATWVRALAVHADTALATLVTRGLAEIAARAAVVAAEAPVSVPAGPCATPTAAANALKQAVQGGSSLYQGHLIYQEQLITCGDAITDPAWMASDATEDAELWNSFATFSFASYLCTANPAYCRVTASPVTLAFGQVALGAGSAVLLSTVRNNGTAPITLGTIAMGGANSTQFLRKADLCSGKTLAPGATCTVGAKFVPTIPGALSAKLVIPSPGMVSVAVKLKGTGI